MVRLVLRGDHWEIKLGDVRAELKKLPSKSVHVVIVSPPYWKLRAYDCSDQIGQEATAEEFIAVMVEVFEEVRRVLRDDGMLFLNLGDTYSDNSKSGLPAGSAFGIPWMVAKALQSPFYVGPIKKEADRIWIAAIMDGEGTICGFSSKRKGKETIRTGIHVNIRNTSTAILNRASEIFQNSSMGPDQTGRGHLGKRDTFRWWVHGIENKIAFLCDIYPHLVGKKIQARLAYNFLKLHGKRGSEISAKRKLLVKLLSDANHAIDVEVPDWCVEVPAQTTPGWILRSDVIWNKPSAMPESVTGWRWMRCRKKIKEGEIKRHGIERGVGHVNESRVTERKGGAEWQPCGGCKKCQAHDGMVLRKSRWRPSRSHEYLFVFSKTEKYFADGDSSKEPCTGNAHSRGKGVHPKSEGLKRESGVKANENWSSSVKELVETRNLRSVWSIVSEGLKAKHFAAFPTELVRMCLSAATSRGGCCGKCGAQYAPIVRSERVATRPGRKTKTHEMEAEAIGNRDSKRHTTKTAIDGFKPTCNCDSEVARPIVLDCFAGACRTGRVAINMGCEFIGIEGSRQYAAIGSEEIQRPYDSEAIRNKKKKKRRLKKAVKMLSRQLELDLG